MRSHTSAALRGRLRRLLPDTPLARSLALQSGMYAVGSGVFLTGNAVFFTQIVGLTAAQVGLGISVAGVVSFLVSVPLGRLADRIGPRRTWAMAAFLEAALYLAYPFARGLSAFLGLVVMLALAESLGSAGRGAYTIDALPPGERVKTLAYLRSALNVGFTVGALVSGVALGLGDRAVIMAVPVFAGVTLAVNAVIVSRMPDVRHDGDGVTSRVLTPTALRNKAFLSLSFVNGLLNLDMTLFNVVIPLWLVQRTDAPHALLAWLFTTNTVMAVLLQVAAARGADSVRGSVRAARLAAASLVLTCLLVMGTSTTSAVATMVLLWLGVVAVTAAELFHSASGWGFLSELSDPARGAEYQGVWRLGIQMSSMVGPAAFTWLCVAWRPAGWLVVAAVAVVGAVLIRPAAEAAERALAQGKPGGDAAFAADTIEQSA